MKFSVNRDSLLRPLQQAASVVERRQTHAAILSNLLLRVTEQQLSITGTDLEVELIARLEVSGEVPGDITVPTRKLVDICREIPEGATIEFTLNEQRLELRSGRFRSILSTLPADDFPAITQDTAELSVELDSEPFGKLLGQTAFAMAQQDVRYFLNGMLLELGAGLVRSVTTDGHRLALGELAQPELEGEVRQVIVPRKGIMEIQRLLQEIEGKVAVSLTATHLCIASPSYTLTTKLVDGKYPDYKRVIPQDGDKVVVADKQELHRALNRTAILANEKFRGIRVTLDQDSLQLSANNPEQEEAEEAIAVEYKGSALEVGFNVSYLQDVLTALEGDKVQLTLLDASSSSIIRDPGQEGATYVVMPMKL